MLIRPNNVLLGIISGLLLLTSCGDVYNRNKEYIHISATDEAWLVGDDNKEEFVLTDSVGNTEIFFLENEWSGQNMSGSSSGMFDKQETFFEVQVQEFQSAAGTKYSMRMQTEDPPQGTTIGLKIADVGFTYDLRYSYLCQVHINRRHSHHWFWDGYYQGDDTINSIAVYLDTVMIGDKVYHGALRFTLKDFEDEWESGTLLECTIAKGVGLLSYKLNNGYEMWRKD